ncbi:MAG: hypothetical protein KCHDKBKB_00176 [Elusimicrobia bacterium]|nr:hypothetical protein [Elusimicrobiota bacterium]
MEARLFFVALWCGLYGYLIRLAMRKEDLIENPAVIMVINSLFWMTFAAMVGMLVASYSERLDQTTRFSLVFGLVGGVIGIVSGLRKSRQPEAREELIRDDLEWADTGFSAILLASVVMFFIVQAFKIPSGSMRMTFVEGDHLFVNKFIYGLPIPLTQKKIVPLRKIKQGDIVIFRYPARNKDNPHYGKDFIKRCIALEGQKVEIIDKKVFVNDVELVEPYKQHVEDNIFPKVPYALQDFQEKWQSGLFEGLAGNDIRDNFGPVVVPPGCILVMGDNRDRSFDSRFWGPLKVSAVKGRAWLRYWPLKRFKLVK